MRINNNILALQTVISLSKTSNKIQNSVARLNTGKRINSAKDDAAGLTISNKISSYIKSMDMANRNSLDGISLIQTAEAALGEINNILQRMRELAVQAATDTFTSSDREKIQFEVNSLREEITSISFKTEFNNIKLLKGESSRMVYGDNVDLASIVYISDTIKDGNLSLDIDSVGTHAKITTNYPIPSGVNGQLNINGEKIDILVSDSSNEILEKIREVCNYVGVNVLIDGNKIHLVTKEAGSKQKIDISTNNPALSVSLGITNGTRYGIDSKVSNVVFLDSLGNLDGDFNNSSVVHTDGNRVEITSSNGKKIFMDIKVNVNGDGSFALLNGELVTDAGIIPAAITIKNDILDYGPIVLQVGAGKFMEIEIQLPTVTSESLGVENLNFQTSNGAEHAIIQCDKAISVVSSIRAKLGAYQNRLEYTTRNLDSSVENAQASLSRILDTDMAKEMTYYTQNSVISQAAMSILAQANQRPQQILQLLR